VVAGNAFQMSHHRLANTASGVCRQDKHRVDPPCHNIEHFARHNLIGNLGEVKVFRRRIL